MEITVGTTELKVLGRNGGRRYLLFVNQHTADIRISFSNYPAAQGVIVASNGGSWELDANLFNSLPYDSLMFQNVNAIAASTSGTLTVFEV